MKLSFSLIFIIVFAFIIPTFTLNKKFDLFRKALLSSKSIKLKKILLNISSLSKWFIYFLLAGKLYFTLYVLSYMAFNQILLSAISALILLAISITLLYLFWNLKSKTQNLIMKTLGVSLISFLFFVFLIIFVIFLHSVFINFHIDEKLFYISKIFFRYFILSYCFVIISFSFAFLISFFLSKVNFHKNNIKKYLYKFFYFISGAPTIIFCFLPYLIFETFLSNYPFIQKNSEIYLLSLIAIFYSIVIVDKMINHHFSTPTNILNKNKITLGSTFINAFFEINFYIQFIFFIQQYKNIEYNNIFSIFINSLKNQDTQSLFFIGLLYFIVYIVYFIHSQSQRIYKNQLTNN